MRVTRHYCEICPNPLPGKPPQVLKLGDFARSFCSLKCREKWYSTHEAGSELSGSGGPPASDD